MTYRKSRYGIIVTAKVSPVNPNTADQAQIRANLSAASAAWSVMSDSARAAWSLYGSNTPLISKSGALYTPSGRTVFMRSYTAALAAGLEPIAAAPTTFGLPSSDPTIAITVSAATQKASIAFDNGQAWAGAVGGALIVSMSKPQNPTVNTPRGGFRGIGHVAGAATPPTTPKALDVAYPCTAGQRVWFEYRILDTEGRLSNTFQVSAVVGA
jgi:hypothetical protein